MNPLSGDPAPMLDFAPVDDHRCRLGESPVWDDRGGRFLWCDIEAAEIRAIRPDGTGAELWPMPDRIGSFGLTETGRLVVALTKAVHLFDPETGRFDELVRLEEDLPHTRLNDGKVGPDGAFWVGSMDERPERAPIGSLYRVTADGRAERKLDGIRVSNGLAWTADGRTMFHADSRGPWIDRHDFDPATGAIGGRTRIATLDDATGRPDGGACDADGHYWSAGVTAACLNRFDRDGRLLARIDVPVAAPTMPCFGGPDGRLLFLTSLTHGVAAERLAAHPWTGRCLIGSAPIAGAPVGRFRDAG